MSIRLMRRAQSQILRPLAMSRPRLAGIILLATSLGLMLTLGASAQQRGPSVVPISEGQIGTSSLLNGPNYGSSFELRGSNNPDFVFGVLRVPTVLLPPPPPELQFFTDTLHGTPAPNSLGSATAPATLVAKMPAASNRSTVNGDDFFVFSFTTDGTNAGTERINIRSFDNNGQPAATATIDNVPTFTMGPFESVNSSSVSVDNQGRVTVTYTELPVGGLPPRVRGQRFNGLTSALIGAGFQVGVDGQFDPNIALLDPAGNRLLVTSTNGADIKGNIVDTTGPVPVVLPEFTISTTAGAFGNGNQAVAVDPANGAYTAVWENVSGIVGDPVNVRGRRFDAMGNPIGGDFQVNATSNGSQGQAGVAYGPGNVSAVVWAGDSQVAGDELDVFLQVYDAMGNPIGGEVRVNTDTTAVQDRPAVRFLPQTDGQGRPQVAVVWRDVGVADGGSPRGTGTSYRCFAVEGVVPGDMPIFADGFESGDTTSWSDQTTP